MADPAAAPSAQATAKAPPAATPKKAPRFRVRVRTPEGFELLSKPAAAKLPVPLPPIEGELPKWTPPPPLEAVPSPEPEAPAAAPPQEEPAKAPPFRLVLADELGQPFANRKVSLAVDGAAPVESTTGGDGLFQAELPAGAQAAELVVHLDDGAAVTFALEFSAEESEEPEFDD